VDESPQHLECEVEIGHGVKLLSKARQPLFVTVVVRAVTAVLITIVILGVG